MARRQSNNSVSLFPFLAVLVCTMGALILLLLVTTRQIRMDQREAQGIRPAQAALPIPPSPPASPHAAESLAADLIPAKQADIAQCEREIAELEKEREQLQRRIIELQADLEFATTDYERRAVVLESVRQEIQQMKTAAAAVADEEGAAALVASFQHAAELQAQQTAAEASLTDLKQRLQDERQKQITLTQHASAKQQQLFEQRSALLTLRKQTKVLAEQQAAQATQGTQTVVEFSNPSGTSRTPIILNLTETGYEFVPNGIRLTEQDMQGFPVKDNPLLSAVLTIHRYRSKDSATAEPYALLLVRPDGTLPFYTAQRVFTEAGIHYGYELLEADQVISVEPADDEELRLVRRSVLESLNKRETLYAVLRRQLEATADASRGSGGAGDGETRQLVIRPDGRVVQQESRPGRSPERRSVEGRFYAGGEAPPTPLYRPQERRSLESAAQGQGESAAAADSLFGPSPRLSTIHDQPPRWDSAGDPAVASVVPQPSPQVAADSDSFRNRSTATAAVPSGSDVEQEMQDFLRSLKAEGQLAQQTGPPAQNRSADLDANPSRPSDDSAHPPTSSPQVPSSEKEHVPLSESFATGRLPGRLPVEASTPTFPSSGAAGATSSSGLPGSGGAAGGSSEASGVAGGPPSIDTSHVDPKLLGMLDPPQRKTTEHSTPVGITVFLDADHMTVGQRSAQVTDPAALDRAFGFLLKSISEDVDAVRQSPQQPMLPIVKFIVSPGGEQTRFRLARELREIGIPSATVFELEPHVTAVDNVGRASIGDSQPAPPEAEATGTSNPTELPQLPPIPSPPGYSPPSQTPPSQTPGVSR